MKINIPEIIILFTMLLAFIEQMSEVSNLAFKKLSVVEEIKHTLMKAGILIWGGFFDTISWPQIIYFVIIILNFSTMNSIQTMNGKIVSKKPFIFVIANLFFLVIYYYGGLFD